MRVLWFTNTSSCYREQSGKGYNGGGWISSLEEEIKKNNDIELGVCFYSINAVTFKKEEQEGAIYYILPRPKKTLYYSLITILGKDEQSSEMQEKIAMSALLDVVNDFKPDIIHVFGSENIYGLLAKYIKIPLILHIQGILSPCYNAFLPPFLSWKDYTGQASSLIAKFRLISEKISWRRNSFTERRMFKNIKYFMGRTDWDKRVLALLNPSGRYYYCSEMLRNVFYLENVKRSIPDKPVFVTTISSQLYKGFDILLKTAQVLKKNIGIDFEWRVYGDISPVFIEKKFGIKHSDVNVVLMGVASAEVIKESLLSCTAYIHTSYIDNSPNSLCEATLLGVTTISTNVGGIPSLIEDGKTGFLVPANDPYQMAYLMKYIMDHKDKNMEIGLAAREVAIERHDRNKILKRVLEIYNDVIKNEYSTDI